MRHVGKQEVYVLDLETWEYEMAAIEMELAMNGICHVCIIEEKSKEEMSVFGHIHDCWNLPEFSGMSIMMFCRVMFYKLKSFISFEIFMC